MLVANELYTQLQIFHNRNIQILPLYKVNINNNTKKAFAESLFANWPNTTKPFSDVRKSLKAGVTGYIIKTGKCSNVFVVDYDTKPTTAPEFLKRLIDTNTFYVKTPSGGYHFYFKYDKLMVCNRTAIFGNIDIRSNGGCCFFGNRNDGDYNAIDNEIKECPNDILTDIYEYHKIPTSKEIDLSPVYGSVNNSTRKYNISDESLVYLLNYLPDEYLNEFKKWYSITAVLKKANYIKAWDEWSKKGDTYHNKNNAYIWSKINTENTNCDLNFIVYLVNKHLKENNTKPSLFTNIEIVYNEYKLLTDMNAEKINKVINQKYLTPVLFQDVRNNNILLIQSGLGTGKTSNTIKWTIENDYKLLSIVHLTSLHDNQIGAYNTAVSKYNEENGTQIQNMSSYQNIKNFTNKSICTTINSLVKTLAFIDVSEYYIYIDEVHRIISYLLHSSTLNNKRRDAFKSLTQSLRECKGVIGTDGDICDITMEYFSKIGLTITFVKNTYKSFENIPVTFYNKRKIIIDLIEEYVHEDKRFTLCCNTKNAADEVNMRIKRMGVNPDSIKLYTSQSGDIVANVSESWEDNFIIYSPSIVEGVDRTSKEPETVFVLISSENTIDAEQVKQQICRNRNIKEVHVAFNKMTNTLHYNSFDELKTTMIENVNSFNKNFKEFLDVRTDINDADVYIENLYSDLFIMSSYRNNTLAGNFKYNLKVILTNAGFVVNDLLKNDNTIIKKYNVLDIDVELDVNILFDAYLNRTLSPDHKFYKLMEDRREICGCISKDKIGEFKLIFIDDDIFSTYLNIRQLIKNDSSQYEKLKHDLKNEYIIKYYDSTIPIIIKYKLFMSKYLPEINIYEYEYNEDDTWTRESVNISEEDFKFIKKVIRSKKEMPKTKKELLKIMNMYIKNIFGNNMIRKKKTQKRDGDKQINYYIYTFDRTLFQNIINLNKYTIDNSNIVNIDKVIVEKYLTA